MAELEKKEEEEEEKKRRERERESRAGEECAPTPLDPLLSIPFHL